MPINIQEILYPNDSDSIKWEKVNYNFDQIIATGGKEGPKGEKGSTGPTGLLGLQGDKGEKGDLGEKGATGTSTNYWDQFTSSTQGITSYVIKPKNGTGDDQAAIIIGDGTYDEGNTDGVLNPSAQLTVYTDSYYYSQKWGPSSGSDFLTFRGESTTINGASGTKWIIQPEGQGTNTELLLNAQKININSSNNIDLSGDDIVLTSSGDLDINSSDVNIATSGLVLIDSDSTITLDSATNINIKSSDTGSIELRPNTLNTSSSAIRIINTSGGEVTQMRGKISWGVQSYLSANSNGYVSFDTTLAGGSANFAVVVQNNASNASKFAKFTAQSNSLEFYGDKILIKSSGSDKIKLANNEIVSQVPVQFDDNLNVDGIKSYGVQVYNFNPTVAGSWNPPTTLTSSFLHVFVGMDYISIENPIGQSFSYNLNIPDGSYIGQRLFVRVVVLPASFTSFGNTYTSLGDVTVRARQYANTYSTIDTASSTSTTGEELMIDMIWVENDRYSNYGQATFNSRGNWRVLSNTTQTINS